MERSCADAAPRLERERAVSDLARVEGEQRGTICLVRVHGEIDLSNAHEVSSEIGVAMGQEARRLVVGLGDGSSISWRLADLPFAGCSISRACRGSSPWSLDWKTRWPNATTRCPTSSPDRMTSST